MATGMNRRGDRWPVLPAHGKGQVIGLLGGSFNPPHDGHRHISELALQRIGLDALWWLVTPGNPLKTHDELAPLAERTAATRAIVSDSRIKVTTIEADIGQNRTRDTLRFLLRRTPTTRFVWLMGADNLAGFHRWQGWLDIAFMVPIAVFDRPNWSLRALTSPAALRLSRFRIDESDARLLPRLAPPAWAFLHTPRSSLSSTELRRKQVTAASTSGKAAY
jgi:nicotinate-nucleotide adenylyltransferase